MNPDSNYNDEIDLLESWQEIDAGEESKTAEPSKMERIAIAALEELEKTGQADFLLLKNDELREFWAAHKAELARRAAIKAERERRARVKQEALSKLSHEEQVLLGLRPAPVKRKRPAKKTLIHPLDLTHNDLAWRVSQDDGEYHFHTEEELRKWMNDKYA